MKTNIASNGFQTQTSISAVCDRAKTRSYWRPLNGRFIEYGYAGVSVDSIAEKAGVSKRTVYSKLCDKTSALCRGNQEVVQRRSCRPQSIKDRWTRIQKHNTSAQISRFSRGALPSHRRLPSIKKPWWADSRQFPDAGKMMFDGPVMRTQHVFGRLTFETKRKLGSHAISQYRSPQARSLWALLKINMHMSLMLNQPTSVSHRKLEEVARASIHLFLHGAPQKLVAGQVAEKSDHRSSISSPDPVFIVHYPV